MRVHGEGFLMSFTAAARFQLAALAPVVLAAVLQVMHSHAVAEPAAFALIRRAAMEQRKTIEQMSAEIAAKGSLPRATG